MRVRYIQKRFDNVGFALISSYFEEANDDFSVPWPSRAASCIANFPLASAGSMTVSEVMVDDLEVVPSMSREQPRRSTVPRKSISHNSHCASFSAHY